MAEFLFRLETVEGEPADPPTLSAVVPNWKPGDSIGRKTDAASRGVADEDADQPPVLVVEDTAG